MKTKRSKMLTLDLIYESLIFLTRPQLPTTVLNYRSFRLSWQSQHLWSKLEYIEPRDISTRLDLRPYDFLFDDPVSYDPQVTIVWHYEDYSLIGLTIRDPHGQKLVEASLSPDGLLHGQCLFFYADGTVRRRLRYRDSLCEGTQIYYYESGNVSDIIESQGSYLHGYWTTFVDSHDVQVESRVFYDLGLRIDD